VPTRTWERLDPVRRAAIVEAAEQEFGSHGFADGSLNVIARQAGVAKGSLFQYFSDKTDLCSHIGEGVSYRVRSHMEDRMVELDPRRPLFDFLADVFESWVEYFAKHPRERALTAATQLEQGTAAAAVRGICDRHFLEVVAPMLDGAQRRGDLRPDADLDALLALLVLLASHLALAPFIAGLDPILGLAEGAPEQPGLAIRRLLAPLAAAFGPSAAATTPATPGSSA
jgi:AcrR family transcriptional regulator